ncbi:hypothetical protein [Kamptonema formosum]|uniref:hypothetical protein n=1 Tax=Kamptonema formosum TaxID=331992 RepID=UPI000345D229|nr:hypothetical protein [Oscillatoria sp. PCC 10802]
MESLPATGETGISATYRGHPSGAAVGAADGGKKEPVSPAPVTDGASRERGHDPETVFAGALAVGADAHFRVGLPATHLGLGGQQGLGGHQGLGGIDVWGIDVWGIDVWGIDFSF